jgi:TM2 domain-containing membrane protein YozV
MGEQKSSGIAVVLSFFIPGLGQIYNGQIGKGIVFIILAAIFAVLTTLLIGLILYPLLWIYGMYDAYKTAAATNKSVARDTSPQPNDEQALKTLKMRYAKGEITKKQFDQMKEDLE